jgi:hypothetical protein
VFSVIFTALKILQQISYSAEEEYTNLLAHCNDSRNAGQRLGELSRATTPVPQEIGTRLQTSPSSSADYDDETVNGLDQLIKTDPTLLETTIARYEIDAHMGPHLQMADCSLRAQAYI